MAIGQGEEQQPLKILLVKEQGKDFWSIPQTLCKRKDQSYSLDPVIGNDLCVRLGIKGIPWDYVYSSSIVPGFREAFLLYKNYPIVSLDRKWYKSHIWFASSALLLSYHKKSSLEIDPELLKFLKRLLGDYRELTINILANILQVENLSYFDLTKNAHNYETRA